MKTGPKMPDCGLPPFFKPTTADEFRERFGHQATIPGGIDAFRPGWTLSFFSVRIGYNRLTDIGWINPPFAVSPQPVDGSGLVYVVTHLPTGQKIAATDTMEHAGQIAELVAPIGNWNDLTVLGAPKGFLETYFDTMAEAGFIEQVKDFGGGKFTGIWARETN